MMSGLRLAAALGGLFAILIAGGIGGGLGIYRNRPARFSAAGTQPDPRT